MNNKYVTASVIITLTVLGGCTSKLSVKNEHLNTATPHESTYCEDKGVPIASMEAHVVTKTVQYFDKDGTLCKETDTAEFQMLPSGKRYCLNISPGWYSKNELTVESNDDGTLKKVVMNSDPQLDEAITATASLVKEIGGILPKAGVLGQPDATSDAKSCGQTTKVFNTGLSPYQKWKERQ